MIDTVLKNNNNNTNNNNANNNTSNAVTNINSKINSPLQQQLQLHHQHHNQNASSTNASATSTKTAVTSSTITSTSSSSASNFQIISITVLRAWDLNEGLGDCNPYVVIDWGKLGRAATQAVPSTTCPHFGSILKFKSPLKPVQWQAKQGVPNVCGVVFVEGIECFLQDVNMKIFVYSRNQSVSDEMLGEATLTASPQLLEYFDSRSQVGQGGAKERRLSQETLVLQLFTIDGVHAGFIEIDVSTSS
jgi:hypothetical protein